MLTGEWALRVGSEAQTVDFFSAFMLDLSPTAVTPLRDKRTAFVGGIGANTHTAGTYFNYASHKRVQHSSPENFEPINDGGLSSTGTAAIACRLN